MPAMPKSSRAKSPGGSGVLVGALCHCFAATFAAVFIGCSPQAPTTQPSTMYERQEKALHDPFSYTPDLKKSDMSVSGQNDPDGLKRDLHDFLNP
jgi:hypothetical protein